MHRSRTLLLLVAAAGCSAPPGRSPDAEIVPCPLNDRANSVLRCVIEECASSHGEWSHDLGPGCPRIWAVQFGLTAGLRRQRDDLRELAEVTASRQNSDLNRLILDAVFGGDDAADGPEAYGVPALFVSGVLGASGSHYAKFRLAFDRALEEMDLSSLPETRLTGTAVLLAEVARTERNERDRWLNKAREATAKISGVKFRAFALAAIAKASGDTGDLRRAREGVETACPDFHLEDGRLTFEAEEAYVLSRYLALVSALADLAQLTGNPLDRTRAEALLDFVFSESLFNGRVLVHDGAKNGFRSDDFCSGCNLNALYLVDRLYGDTFKIDPLPELPERPDPWLMREREVHELFPLRSGQLGSFMAIHFGVNIGYEEVPSGDPHPHGALRLRFSLNDSLQECRFERMGDDGIIVRLDEKDTASYTIDEDSVVEGDYDPEISRYTVEIGPARGGTRQVRVICVICKRA